MSKVQWEWDVYVEVKLKTYRYNVHYTECLFCALFKHWYENKRIFKKLEIYIIKKFQKYLTKVIKISYLCLSFKKNCKQILTNTICISDLVNF